MLAIYVTKITERIKYTFDFVFNNLMVAEYKLYDSLDEFAAVESPHKLCYVKSKINDLPFIYSKLLLFKRDIAQIDITEREIDSVPVIFTHQANGALLPFDPFAAIFYMISRYEEYFPYESDAHGRYLHTNSIAHKYNFLKVPIVHIWGEMLENALLQQFPDLTFEHQKYKFMPTIDVDQAYKYINKGISRVWGGVFKSLFKFDFKNVLDRLAVIFHFQKDPYDVFDDIIALQKRIGCKFKFFFLMADYGDYDKSCPVDNYVFGSLIKHVRDYCDVGIHLSYASCDKEYLVCQEIQCLEDLIHCPITMNRQHFLRCNVKNTYRALYDTDIEEDYTLGYAETTGFRAGVCIPFYFFDLKYNETTNLKLYPLSVMDVTLVKYMKLDSASSVEELNRIITLIKRYNGIFIPLWHNSSLSNQDEWLNKSHIFNEMIKFANP